MILTRNLVAPILLFVVAIWSGDKNDEFDEISRVLDKQDSAINTVQLVQRSVIHSGKTSSVCNLKCYRKGTKFRLESEIADQSNGVDQRIIINNGSAMWQISKGIKRKLDKEEQSYILAMYKKRLLDFLPAKKTVTHLDSLTIIEGSPDKTPTDLTLVKMTLGNNQKRILSYSFRIGNDKYEILNKDWTDIIPQVTLPLKTNVIKNGSLFVETSIGGVVINGQLSDTLFDDMRYKNFDVEKVMKDMF
jgi:hypothetical protein